MLVMLLLMKKELLVLIMRLFQTLLKRVDNVCRAMLWLRAKEREREQKRTNKNRRGLCFYGDWRKCVPWMERSRRRLEYCSCATNEENSWGELCGMRILSHWSNAVIWACGMRTLCTMAIAIAANPQNRIVKACLFVAITSNFSMSFCIWNKAQIK